MIQQLGTYTKTVHLTGREIDIKSLIIRWSWIALIAASLYQGIFHTDIVNLVANFAVALGWGMVTWMFLRSSVIENFPLSSFVILAFASSQLYLPLLFTTLEGKSLTYNLELAEEVFLHSMAGLVVITLAHSIYRFVAKMNFQPPYPLLTKAGFFIPPTDLQLWLFGLIGLASTFYVYFIAPEAGRGITSGTTLDKVIQALVHFTYAPFFIPIGKLYGRSGKFSPAMVPMLIAFTIALFASSIGRNSRGAFMVGFTSVAFAYGLGLLLGAFHTRLFTLRNTLIVGILFWLLTGPIADLGTAMVIVRGEREEIPAAQLIDLTLEAFQDKKAIQERRLADNLNIDDYTDWDERYLDNVFTSRFANIKYNDMSLICAASTGEQDPDMLSYSLDFISYNLPEPLLKLFNIDVDKEFIGSISFGDYLYEVAGGYQGYEGGYKTGHLSGTGMATFGWWYLLILGVGMMPIYFLFDVFYKQYESRDASGGLNFRFSFCILLAITSIWSFLPGESVVALTAFILRGWIQLTLLYFLLFHITRILTSGFKFKFRWGA